MVSCSLGHHNFELPVSYGELTFDQFFKLQKLEDHTDIISIISILSGLDKEIWMQAEEDKILYQLSSILSFLNEPFEDQFLKPDTIEIEGKRYNLPEGIGVNTFGQKIALQSAIEKNKGSDVDIFPYVIALYMQPIVTISKYDVNKVNEMVPKIMNCKIKEGFPLASFFLQSYERYLIKSERDFLTTQQAKSLEQVLNRYKSSEKSPHLSPFRRLLAKALKKCLKNHTTLSTWFSGMRAENLSTQKSFTK